jgi:hypothetical protein
MVDAAKMVNDSLQDRCTQNDNQALDSREKRRPPGLVTDGLEFEASLPAISISATTSF